MGLIKGGVSRLFETFLYFLIFLCSAVGLGIYSYFLSALADRNAYIPRWEKAVEGLTGAAVLYTICAVVLTCCLGGVSFFAFVAIVLDLLFVGAMIAVAILTRHGAGSCRGTVNTPLGTGDANSYDGFGRGFGQGNGDYLVYGVKLGTACRLNTAVFAVSIIAAFLFLCTAAFQVVLVRGHKKENRYGPSPANGYTSGSGKRRGFWTKKNRGTTRDAELGATGGLAAPAGDYRPSHETGYTGTTVGGHGAAPYDKVEHPTGTGVHPSHGYANNLGTNNYTTGTATNY